MSSEQGPATSSFEHGNEPSDAIKGREFLGQMNNYKLLKMDSAL
jgi:hypothetical protein